MPHAIHDPRHNPFATRYVRPGAVPFLFPPECGAERFIERLCANAWWGQVVGAHGSGKTSLIEAISPLLAARRRVISLTLRDGQSNLGAYRRELEWLDADTQVVIDGYEQLGRWSRCLLKGRCRRRGAGLLVTTHTDVGLPTLWRMTPDLATAQRIVAVLLAPDERTIGPADVAGAWQARGGNLREVLFELYDLYERRRGET